MEKVPAGIFPDVRESFTKLLKKWFFSTWKQSQNKVLAKRPKLEKYRLLGTLVSISHWIGGSVVIKQHLLLTSHSIRDYNKRRRQQQMKCNYVKQQQQQQQHQPGIEFQSDSSSPYYSFFSITSSTNSSSPRESSMTKEIIWKQKKA